MKHLRSITLFAFLLALGLPIVGQAQPVAKPIVDTAVAFVKVDRTQLWVKRSDTAGYVIFKANPNNFISINNLAYLDQTRDGKTLLLAGKFQFIPPWNQSSAINWTGVISVPTDSLNRPDVLDHVKFLKTAPYPTLIRPVGAVTPDRKWFVSFNTTAANTTPGLKFYHGSLDSNFNVGGSTADPGLVIDSTSPASSDQLSNWKLSNISVSPDGSSMVAAAAMEPEDPNNFRFYLYYWHFSNIPPFWRVDRFSNYNGMLPVKTFSPDTLFGASVRIIDGDNAEVALTNVSGDPNIHYYTYRYTGFTTLSAGTRSINRSSIPQNVYFYAGKDINGAYNEDPLHNSEGQHSLGGDVMVSKWNADDAVFITHESVPPPDTTWKHVRDTTSAVYRYDFNTGTATKIYNDLGNQELQPQFMLVPGVEWHYPKLSASPTSLSFGTVDSGKTSSKSITLTSTEAIATTVQIDSIVLAGGTNFSMTGGTKTATTVTPSSPITLSVTFKPIDPGPDGAKSDQIKVYWRDTIQKVMTFALSGSEHIVPPPPPPKSVHQEDPAVFAMSVQPNPFAQSARISLMAPEAGSIAIVVHDALGREVYASQSVRTAAGESQEFTFDAKNLGLPTGTYYVTALLGDRAATREVVFVK